jgi:hypothetical protein
MTGGFLSKIIKFVIAVLYQVYTILNFVIKIKNAKYKIVVVNIIRSYP